MTDVLALLRSQLSSKYVIDGYLDKGGQGAVFRGHHDGRPAAIKVFEPTNDSAKRLEREVELLTKLDCPHLVKAMAVDRVGHQGQSLWVVAYELHTGGDLRSMLEARAPQCAEATLAQIGLEIGEAVDALWAHRIVHRDIKPANIVRAADGRFVLVDVGLARHLDRSAITALGLVAGTVGYMSPEQAFGRRNLTIHSDAFSLGVTLFEIAAKAHPFGRNQGRIGASSAPALRSSRPDLSNRFCGLIAQLLSTRASARPAALRGAFAAL
jgi:serine/threonine-protein kinase